MNRLERLKNRKQVIDKTEVIRIKRVKGLDGKEGLKGERGERGLRGVQGFTGEKGERGEKGLQGIQGLPGINGKDGVKGDKGDKGDKGVNWRGEWKLGTHYLVDDAVSYYGSSYICTKEHTAKLINSAGFGTDWDKFWDILALKGEAGKAGASSVSSSSSGVESVVAGTGIAVDNTDPNNPVVSATGSVAAELSVQDEGVELTATPTSIDFVGSGVTATNSGDDVTVTINSGGGVDEAFVIAMAVALG